MGKELKTANSVLTIQRLMAVLNFLPYESILSLRKRGIVIVLASMLCFTLRFLDPCPKAAVHLPSATGNRSR